MELEQIENLEKDNNIVAVFIAQFDVHKGNVLEWQYPKDINLEGIEFQAICSGLHKLKSDTIYFSREEFYGLSVFENKSIQIDRGAYMKSIGVLVKPTQDTGLCGKIWNHQTFLKNEISQHMNESEAIQASRYDNLIQYYHQYKSDNKPIENLNLTSEFDVNSHSLNYNLKKRVKYNSPQDIFSQESILDLIQLFGSDIFILWKAALLRKRIILENIPPIETLCKYVYNLHLLSTVPTQFQNNLTLIPKFSVGVNDIPELEKLTKKSYIACTPDSIYEIKTNLYDLLVLLSKEKSDTPLFKSTSITTKTNQADRKRFKIMIDSLSIQLPNPQPSDVSSILKSAFTDFNYWLYDQKSSVTWQNIFAGTRHHPVPSSLSEHDLLLLDGNEDATEIDNNQVFDVVISRASSEIQSETFEKSQKILKFFLSLNHLLLFKLQSILSLNEEGGLNLIPIYPKDFVQLGLDPYEDTKFLIELVEIYFKKKIKVMGIENLCHIKQCHCCEGSIRI